MVKADVIYLISENPSAHGVFDTTTETPRKVYCTIQSVRMSEFYTAKSAGIDPEIVFVLSDYSEYHGEKILTWHGKRYRVIRTYENGMKIEITAGEITNDN